MKPVTDPPSFFAAVTAHKEPLFSFPSFCSRTASVESRRRRGGGEDRGRVVEINRVARRAEHRAIGSILCCMLPSRDEHLPIKCAHCVYPHKIYWGTVVAHVNCPPAQDPRSFGPRFNRAKKLEKGEEVLVSIYCGSSGTTNSGVLSTDSKECCVYFKNVNT